MSDRRRHFKLQELPDALQRQVDQMIANGSTYRDIAAVLDGEGYEIGKSSVARYGKQFLTTLERLKSINEQARAIVSETGGDLDVAEDAAARVATARIVDFMMSHTDMSEEKFSSMVHALARLQSSSVARERLSLQYEKAKSAAATELKAELTAELKDHPDLLDRLERIIEQKLEEATP